jgi:glycosyltransferase involved in cell wall biosynthesis
MVLPAENGLRVLMTTDAVGGVWNYCVRLAGALQGYGVHIALATMGPAPNEHQHAELRPLPHVQLYEGNFKLEWMQDPWDDVDRAGQWLLDLHDHFHPDIVHLNNYAHAGLPWSAPVLVAAHSCVCSWFEAVRQCQATQDWDEYRWRVRHALRRADLVTAPTAAALQALGKHYGPFRAGVPIYNGYDHIEDSAQDEEPAREVVFCAGRLWDPAKNIAVLDRAAQDICRPVFAAGTIEGPDGQWIELKNLKGLGYLDQARLREWYRRTAVFVQPSLYEPFGLTALEAGLAGCALVLSDIPSLREIWSDAAVFVPPRDHQAMAREINRLVADEGLRQQYACRAGERARAYTLRRMAENYYRSYRSLIQGEPVTSGEPLTGVVPRAVPAGKSWRKGAGLIPCQGVSHPQGLRP